MRRRTLLGLTAGAVAATTLWQPRAWGIGPADRARILQNACDAWVGTSETNEYIEVRPRVEALVKSARSRIKDLGKAKDGEVFAGLALGSSEANLTATFTGLADIALATRLPKAPSDLFGNLDLQLQVIDALALVHRRWYGDQDAGYYGNWYDWEIGMPTQITKAFTLLADTVAAHRPGLLQMYLASMDAYLRKGRNGDVDLTSRFHTGANLADITTNRILQGALLGDDDRVTKAVGDQLTIYATVDPDRLVNGVTDGFYADGSFLQHESVAHTGTYGTALLARSVQLIRILDGTGWSRRDDLVPVVHGWIARGFAPVIFEGWMMEAVKGRGVSRTTTGYADVIRVLEPTIELSTLADPGEGAELAGWVKHIVAQTKVPVPPDSFSSPSAIVRFAQVLLDPNVVAVNLAGDRTTYAFNAMERNVHLRPGWAFTLSRTSSRVSKYEYMNGENLQPWFQGEGAHQLYLGGQDHRLAYGVDHLACVPAYGLAGVTAPPRPRETVPEAYDGDLWYENASAGFTSSSEKQNAYVYFPRSTSDHSGSVTLGRFAAVSMVLSDDVTVRDRRAGKIPSEVVATPNARANRSWFLFDDEIVMIASGITDSPDLTAPRALQSTIDARLSEPRDKVDITVRRYDGRKVGVGTHRDVQWVLWENHTQGQSVGYHFLDHPVATAALERRTASRRSVREANPDTKAIKDVFSLSLAHRRGGVENYAVAMVPRATAERLSSLKSALTVLANSVAVHAVRQTELGVTMINTFTSHAAKVGDVVVDGVASVVLSEDDGLTRLAVTDPTTKRESITISLQGEGWRLLGVDDRTTATTVKGGLRLHFDTRALHGGSIVVSLRHDG